MCVVFVCAVVWLSLLGCLRVCVFFDCACFLCAVYVSFNICLRECVCVSGCLCGCDVVCV